MDQVNDENLNEIFDPPLVENETINLNGDSIESENVLNHAIGHDNSVTDDDDHPNYDEHPNDPNYEVVTDIATVNVENPSSENETEVSSEFNSANEFMGEGSGSKPIVMEKKNLTENSTENVQAAPVSAKGKPMIKCPHCLKNGETKWVEEKHGMNSHINTRVVIWPQCMG